MSKLEAQQQMVSYAQQIADMTMRLATGQVAKRQQACVVRTIKLMQAEIKTLSKVN